MSTQTTPAPQNATADKASEPTITVKCHESTAYATGATHEADHTVELPVSVADTLREDEDAQWEYFLVLTGDGKHPDVDGSYDVTITGCDERPDLVGFEMGCGV